MAQYSALPLGELAAKPTERVKHNHTKTGSKALSVTCGDSSPTGRAKGRAKVIWYIGLKKERISIDTLL